MSDNVITLTPTKSPFNDANTTEKAYEPGQVININTPAPAAAEPVITEPAPLPAATAAPAPAGDIFNTDEFLKKEFGWQNADEAKAAKAELETLRTKAPELKYGVPEDKQEEY